MIKLVLRITFMVMLSGCEANTPDLVAANATVQKNNDMRLARIENPEICMSDDGRIPTAPAPKGLYIGQDIFGATDIALAEQGFGQFENAPVVTIRLLPDAARRFGKISAANVGKALPIFIDGILLSCPIVNEPIFGGELQLSGNFTLESVSILARQLKNK